MRSATLRSIALPTLLALVATPMAIGADDDHPVVVLDTTVGPITVELDRTKAPITRRQLPQVCRQGLLRRHCLPPRDRRPGFMIQTGGFTENNGVLFEKRKDGLPPIKNESGNGLSNVRGTLAMARTHRPELGDVTVLHQPRRQHAARQLPAAATPSSAR